jgi:hypothetical protein
LVLPANRFIQDLDPNFGTPHHAAGLMGGAEPGMVLRNAYGYGLFTGGLGLHAGGERMGMTVAPASGGMNQLPLGPGRGERDSCALLEPGNAVMQLAAHSDDVRLSCAEVGVTVLQQPSLISCGARD